MLSNRSDIVAPVDLAARSSTKAMFPAGKKRTSGGVTHDEICVNTYTVAVVVVYATSVHRIENVASDHVTLRNAVSRDQVLKTFNSVNNAVVVK